MGEWMVCVDYQGRYPVFQETDTHLNSKDGKGVFNWRVVYPRIVVPVEACVVQVRPSDRTTQHAEGISCVSLCVCVCV